MGSVFLEHWYEPHNKQRISYLLDHYSFKDKLVLDLGGGIGHISNELSKHGAICTVVEGREVNIELGKKKYPHLTFIKYDLENDFYFGRYDYVLNFGLLYHLKNYQLNLFCSLSALKDNGKLFIDINIFDEHKKVKDPGGLDQSINDHEICHITLLDITNELNEHKFKYERVTDDLQKYNISHPYNYNGNKRAFLVVFNNVF